MAPTSVADRPAPRDGLEARIVDATLECIGRWGVGKTTADDIARAAGISRATLYRAFPGGKDVAFEAVLQHEVARFFTIVTARLDDARTLEDVVVIGFVEASRFLRDHEALQYLLANEPERLGPFRAFHQLGRAVEIAAAATAPHLRSFLADDAAALAAADWCVRLFFSYALNPSPSLDLTDEVAVRRFARTHVLPALGAGSDPHPASADS